jgi:hypothetical protein
MVFVTTFPVRSQVSANIALPNCLGKPEVKPSNVVFSCADGYFRVDQLEWTGWGSTFAAAVGSGVVNDCEPDCARGHSHKYPMVILASGRQRCPNGQSAYEEVVYAFIGRSPYPSNDEAESTLHFPCRPMP